MPELVYGGPSLAVTRNTAKSQQNLTDIHEGASFKPAGPGKKKHLLGKFPEFMADPPKELKRVKKDENAEDIPAFRPSTKFFSRPTPSVVTNYRNIRSAFPSLFRR
jgi:hypothetical protein